MCFCQRQILTVHWPVTQKDEVDEHEVNAFFLVNFQMSFLIECIVRIWALKSFSRKVSMIFTH